MVTTRGAARSTFLTASKLCRRDHLRSHSPPACVYSIPMALCMRIQCCGADIECALVQEYCCRVLGQSLNLEVLIDYEIRLISSFPRAERKIVRTITHPNPYLPGGWEVVSREQVYEYWGAVTLESIIDDSRARKLSNDDKDKKRFLFVVAVNMRRGKKCATPGTCSSTAVCIQYPPRYST